MARPRTRASGGDGRRSAAGLGRRELAGARGEEHRPVRRSRARQSPDRPRSPAGTRSRPGDAGDLGHSGASSRAAARGSDVAQGGGGGAADRGGADSRRRGRDRIGPRLGGERLELGVLERRARPWRRSPRRRSPRRRPAASCRAPAGAARPPAAAASCCAGGDAGKRVRRLTLAVGGFRRRPEPLLIAPSPPLRASRPAARHSPTILPACRLGGGTMPWWWSTAAVGSTPEVGGVEHVDLLASCAMVMPRSEASRGLSGRRWSSAVAPFFTLVGSTMRRSTESTAGSGTRLVSTPSSTSRATAAPCRHGPRPSWRRTSPGAGRAGRPPAGRPRCPRCPATACRRSSRSHASFSNTLAMQLGDRLRVEGGVVGVDHDRPVGAHRQEVGDVLALGPGRREHDDLGEALGAAAELGEPQGGLDRVLVELVADPLDRRGVELRCRRTSGLSSGSGIRLTVTRIFKGILPWAGVSREAAHAVKRGGPRAAGGRPRGRTRRTNGPSASRASCAPPPGRGRRGGRPRAPSALARTRRRSLAAVAGAACRALASPALRTLPQLALVSDARRGCACSPACTHARGEGPRIRARPRPAPSDDRSDANEPERDKARGASLPGGEGREDP